MGMPELPNNPNHAHWRRRMREIPVTTPVLDANRRKPTDQQSQKSGISPVQLDARVQQMPPDERLRRARRLGLIADQ